MRKKRPTSVVHAEAIYTADDLDKRGYGYETLVEARMSGIVKGRSRGKRVLYYGKEFIEWVLAGKVVTLSASTVQKYKAKFAQRRPKQAA